MRRTFSGTDRAGGGAFERQFIQLWIFASDGLIVRIEYFDIDRDDEALARFDELTTEPPNPVRKASQRRLARAWSLPRGRRRPRLAAVCALASGDFIYEDRRKRALLAGDVEIWISVRRGSEARGKGYREDDPTSLKRRAFFIDTRFMRAIYGGQTGKRIGE